MKLLTKEILDAFKKQGDTSEKEGSEIKVICKFFNPTGCGTWYCYEYFPDDRIFMGYAELGDLQCAECGTISLDELEEFKGRFGLGIERDKNFPIGKMTLDEVRDAVQSGKHI